jgi:outer membrane lipoprotein SlyB
MPLPTAPLSALQAPALPHGADPAPAWRRPALTLLCAAALLGAGCSTTNPDVVQRGDAQRLSTVTDAVVLSVRDVVVDGSQSGIGATAGGIAGGIAGSSVGGRREAAIVGVLGAVVGGVVGNAVERTATREEGQEIIVQLANGDRRALVQAKGDDRLAPGDAVVLVASGGKVRLVRAPAAPAGTAAPVEPTPTAARP